MEEEDWMILAIPIGLIIGMVAFDVFIGGIKALIEWLFFFCLVLILFIWVVYWSFERYRKK